MSDWMKESTVSDIQTAIQSQTIQTALERNISDLSPQALQSFLTQAPIPRFYYDAFGNTFAPGGTTVHYGITSKTLDIYSMMNISTGIVTIPIDGCYSFSFSTFASPPAATGFYLFASIQNTDGTIYANNLQSGVATISWVIGTAATAIPLRAGATVGVVINNGTATTATPSSGNFGGVWTAPFTNYQGGQN